MTLFLYIILIIIIVDLFLIFFIFYLKKRKKFSDKDIRFIKMNWYRILDLSAQNPEKAIIDADKLLDFALSKKGKIGCLGEKLKKSEGLFSNINSVWKAHKLRNTIAHDFKEISKAELKNTIKIYKKAFNDLGLDI